MKNLSRRFIIASVAALTMAASVPALSANIELVYANGYPRTTISTGIIADEWIAEIEKATEVGSP